MAAAKSFLRVVWSSDLLDHILIRFDTAIRRREERTTDDRWMDGDIASARKSGFEQIRGQTIHDDLKIPVLINQLRSPAFELGLWGQPKELSHVQGGPSASGKKYVDMTF